MRISNLLRASLESASEVTVGPEELAVDNKLTNIVQEFNEQPTSEEILADVETATTAVEVLDEIAEMRDSGDTVAMEAAMYGLSVFQRSHGIHSHVGMESLHGDTLPFLRESILTAATESLEKDIQKMHKKFDINHKSINETRSLLSRVRNELRKNSGAFEHREVEINLQGVLSYFSRNMVPVHDIVGEIKKELEHIKTMRKASDDTKKRIIDLAKQINSLPNTVDGIAEFNNLLNQFNIFDVAKELGGLDLLNSGKITLDEDEYSNQIVNLNYHLIKDGSSFGLKNWLKVAGKAVLSSFAGKVVWHASGSRFLGSVVEISGWIITGMQAGKAKRDRQGSKTHVYQSYTELDEYLDVVDDIMNVVLQDSIRQSELTNAISMMYAKSKQLAVHAQGDSLGNMGKQTLALVGNIIAKSKFGVDAELGKDKLEEIMSDNVFKLEMINLALEEAVDTHCIVTGACAVSMCNNILASIKK